MFRYVALFGILYVLGWLAYLELSPSLGNIWWRQGAEGSKESLGNLGYRDCHGAFWHPSFWDMNPWPVLGMLVCFAVAFSQKGGVKGEP